jgi:hypothetical protein
VRKRLRRRLSWIQEIKEREPSSKQLHQSTTLSIKLFESFSHPWQHHLLAQHQYCPDLVEAVGDQSEPGQAGYHYGDYDAIGRQRSACSTEISMCHDRHPLWMTLKITSLGHSSGGGVLIGTRPIRRNSAAVDVPLG